MQKQKLPAVPQLQAEESADEVVEDSPYHSA